MNISPGPGILAADGAECSVQEQYTQTEWSKLVRLPVVVFRAVALADGRADSGEQNCFLEYVNRSTHADPLLKFICGSLAEQGREVLQMSQSELDFRTFLADVRGVLEERLDPQQRRSFLAGLLCLGHHVADASGGFWGLGNRVSAVESARLEEVSSLLGLAQLLDQA